MSYWEERQTAMYKAGEMKVNQYFTKLEKAFNQTKRELQKTVELFYFRYAEENGLAFEAAQKRLDKAEIGELKDFIELAMENIGKYNQEVNNMSIKARITRYQALEAQIDALLRQLYAIDYQEEAEKAMQEVYSDTYYRTWYNIDQYRGFHSAFAQVNPTTVEKLLEYPFNGANFSSRLWKQKDHLQTVLMESLTTMMIQGVPPQNLAGDLAKKMQTKKFEAYRLLHTESSFLMSEAAHAGYKEDGVEKYQILATLDSKTCGICGDLDGEIYLVEEAVTGKNMPPFHCFCRCTDVPYYDDTDLSDQTRVARDEDGNPIGVPADMTWKEWKEKYSGLESDSLLKTAKKQVKQKLVGAEIVSFENLPDGISQRFMKDLKKADKDVVSLLQRELGNTDFYVSSGLKSEYIKGVNAVGISKDVEASTIAHELFHKIDATYGVTKGSNMLKRFQEDFEKLDDVETLLQNRFPNAFEVSERGRIRMKQEYRGISDIISAMSKGEISLGYGHSKKYWNQYEAIRLQEIWAQYGRIYYENNPEVVEMIETIFPSGSQRVKLKLRRLAENVER